MQRTARMGLGMCLAIAALLCAPAGAATKAGEPGDAAWREDRRPKIQWQKT